jgi:cytochrome oxidase Cu insertion factor (SCO1/SenC/PrrC family)
MEPACWHFAAAYWHRDCRTAAPRRRGATHERIDVGQATVGGLFTLTERHENRRNLSDFRDKLVLLYFGYTFFRSENCRRRRVQSVR